MSRIITTLLACMAILGKFSTAVSQSATELFLFELAQENNNYTLINPVNISNHIGYDNQPTFINNEELIYVSGFDNQTEIVKLNFVTKKKTRLTHTPESEYSPQPTPDGKYISAVLLGEEGSQMIAKYPLKGGESKIIHSEQKIGYYCWYDKKTIFTFVVGSPPSLQEWNTKNAQFKIIMMNPGRSLYKIPGQKAISFIHKESDDIWYLNSYDPLSDKVEYIAESMKGAEDMTWASDGTAFLTHKEKLYKYHPSLDQDWQLVANMNDFGLSEASRIAISPDRKWIAIVLEE